MTKKVLSDDPVTDLGTCVGLGHLSYAYLQRMHALEEKLLDKLILGTKSYNCP